VAALEFKEAFRQSYPGVAPGTRLIGIYESIDDGAGGWDGSLTKCHVNSTAPPWLNQDAFCRIWLGNEAGRTLARSAGRRRRCIICRRSPSSLLPFFGRDGATRNGHIGDGNR